MIWLIDEQGTFFERQTCDREQLEQLISAVCYFWENILLVFYHRNHGIGFPFYRSIQHCLYNKWEKLKKNKTLNCQFEVISMRTHCPHYTQCWVDKLKSFICFRGSKISPFLHTNGRRWCASSNDCSGPTFVWTFSNKLCIRRAEVSCANEDDSAWPISERMPSHKRCMDMDAPVPCTEEITK